MPKILIVDDSAVDQRLAGGLLAIDPDLEIEYASDGREALEQIAACAPDLVLTDLRMPNVDGLELVARVKAEHPGIPVILMTSVGSEEIAVQALKKGAASYVPKRVLNKELHSTIQSVLDVSLRQFGADRLFQEMTRTEYEFELSNNPKLLPQLINLLQEAVTRIGVCGESDCLRVAIALEEVLANALYHGNLEISSELRDTDVNAYNALVAERLSARPYIDRRIFVHATITREKATFTIRDQGPGFDTANLPDPTAPANFEKAGGRGVMLMRTFMSEVCYNEIGNEVRLTKLAAAPTDASSQC